FYVLKGLLMEILSCIGSETGRIQLKENDLDTVHFHPYQSAVLTFDNKTLAIFGKLHPTFLKNFKLEDVCYAEMILDDLAKADPAKVRAAVLSRYPSVSRDISLMLKEEIPAADLLKLIRKTGGKIVKNCEVFDVYQGEHIAEGYKSISLNIVYEDKEKTLTSEAVNDVHDKIVAELIRQYDAVQR
ncbi:MAG: phenylalanine--tRNA ligase subunit beta, partial [Erysipelotrichaceae bacterium]|nr:phenylalanine--tRNA ligase subunit beta [Erysipelotrichaceae bacterium]